MNPTHHGPQLAQDAFFLPRTTNAQEYRIAHHWALRHAVEAQIDLLISFLDEIDLDPDMEPSLGRPEANISAANDDFDPRSGWLHYTYEGDQTAPQGGRHDCENDADFEDMGDDEDGHDREHIDAKPAPTAACGRMVLA